MPTRMSARRAALDEGDKEDEEEEDEAGGENLVGKFAAVSGEDEEEEEEEGEEEEGEDDDEEEEEEEEDDDDGEEEEEEEEEEERRAARGKPKKTVSIASPASNRGREEEDEEEDEGYYNYNSGGSPKHRGGGQRYRLQNPFRGGHIQGRAGGGIARGRLVASQEPDSPHKGGGGGGGHFPAIGGGQQQAYQVSSRVDTKQSEMVLRKQLDSAMRKLFNMSRLNESLLHKIDASESLTAMERLRTRLVEQEAVTASLQSEHQILSDVARKQERMLQEFTREVAEDRIPDISVLSEVRQLKSRISNIKLILNETRQREKKGLARIEVLRKRVRILKRKLIRKARKAAEEDGEDEEEEDEEDEMDARQTRLARLGVGRGGGVGVGKLKKKGGNSSKRGPESHASNQTARTQQQQHAAVPHPPPGFARAKRDAMLSINVKSRAAASGSSSSPTSPTAASGIGGGDRSFKSILASMSGVHQANQILQLKSELYKVHQEKEALNEELLEKERQLQAQSLQMRQLKLANEELTQRNRVLESGHTLFAMVEASTASMGLGSSQSNQQSNQEGSSSYPLRYPPAKGEGSGADGNNSAGTTGVAATPGGIEIVSSGVAVKPDSVPPASPRPFASAARRLVAAAMGGGGGSFADASSSNSGASTSDMAAGAAMSGSLLLTASASAPVSPSTARH